jgi:hypothetical protein
MTIRLGQAAQDPDVPSGRQSPAGRKSRTCLAETGPGWGLVEEALSC